MIWLAVFALCAISFLFAGMEAGLLSVDPVGLRQHVKQRTSGARRLSRLLAHPERQLVTVLLITNTADICALLLATRALIRSFGHAGYFIAVVGAIPIYLFALGVLPKALFRRFPIRALGALVRILDLTSRLLWPIVFLGERMGRLLLPRKNSERTRLFAAREELKQIATQSEREGSLTATERAMIHNVVDFRNVRARDVMTPIAQAISLKAQTPLAEVMQLSRTSGRICFPVIGENGEALGLVNVLEILFDQTPGASLAKYTRRIVAAAESEPAYRIIRKLRAARVGLAAVLSPQQKLIGIASDSELIKRLVQSA